MAAIREIMEIMEIVEMEAVQEEVEREVREEVSLFTFWEFHRAQNINRLVFSPNS